MAPIYVAGNPTCEELGYGTAEFKIDNVNGPFAGTYSSSDGYVTLTVSSDGTYITWSSNVGIDAVLVKGGSNANAFVYSPESLGDSNLASPENPSNGGIYAISHVSFCFDYEVQVTKTAATSLTRDFSWAIDKEADQSSLLLSAGQSFLVNYTVAVTSTGNVDSDWAAEGTITITNPAPYEAVISGVGDEMDGVSAPVDCGAAFPITLASGATLQCTYQASLPDAASRTNIATVTTTGLVGGNTGSAAVDFASAAVNPIDDCVDVTDSLMGPLGIVCADSPQTFSYAMSVGPFASPDECGPNSVLNVASFTGDSAAEAGSDSWTVAVEVACQLGCTLTQGYWKTHSDIGPAPYDNTWAILGGPNTPFFTTGMSWYQMLWTPPQGSAYTVLAHQYAAAYLNALNGADTSAVTNILASANALLTQYASNPSGVKGAARTQALFLASSLDSYNNGLTGPGHCSE